MVYLSGFTGQWIPLHKDKVKKNRLHYVFSLASRSDFTETVTVATLQLIMMWMKKKCQQVSQCLSAREVSLHDPPLYRVHYATAG